MSKTNLLILGATLAFAAVSASPVLAGARIAATAKGSEAASPATELARGVVGAPSAEVYAPTGEPIDLTVTVVSSRISD